MLRGYGLFIRGGGAYQVHLSESYFPAQGEDCIAEITVGDALVTVVRARPAHPFLNETLAAGSLGRRGAAATTLDDAGL
jgi:hypothetical protein